MPRALGRRIAMRPAMLSGVKSIAKEGTFALIKAAEQMVAMLEFANQGQAPAVQPNW